MDTYDLEVRTRSVPTAACLMLLGYKPLGVVLGPDGGTTVRFSPAAQASLEEYRRAKQRIDMMIEDTARGAGR